MPSEVREGVRFRPGRPIACRSMVNDPPQSEAQVRPAGSPELRVNHRGADLEHAAAGHPGVGPPVDGSGCCEGVWLCVWTLRVTGGFNGGGWEWAEAVHAGADHGEVAGGGEAAGAGLHSAVVKAVGDHRSDVLSVAVEVRGDERGGGRAVEAVGAGERAVEEDRRQPGVGHPDVEGLAAGKLVSPSRRRAAVAYLQRRYRVSERRACQLVGQHRSTNRHQPDSGAFERPLDQPLARAVGGASAGGQQDDLPSVAV